MARLMTFIVTFFTSFVLQAVAVHAAPEYVGSEGCKCHKSEISDWERSKHARAFDLLKAGKKKSSKKKADLDPDKDYSNDEKCIGCHVTGYLKDGGFADEGSTPLMAGVGCESCHGAGGEYRKLHKDKGLTFTRDEAKAAGELYGSIDAAVCEVCHTHKDNPFKGHIDKDFDFDINKFLKDTRSFHDYYELEGKH